MPKISFLQLLAENKMTLCSNMKPCERWENYDKSNWFPSHLLTSRSDENTYEIINQTTEKRSPAARQGLHEPCAAFKF